MKILEASTLSLNIELLSYRKQSESWSSEKAIFTDDHSELILRKQGTIVKMAKLEAELTIKDELIERLFTKKQAG